MTCYARVWDAGRMDRIRRGNSGFAAEVGSHLGNLRIVAAADHTGSGTRLGIAGKVAGSLLGTLAVVQKG